MPEMGSFRKDLGIEATARLCSGGEIGLVAWRSLAVYVRVKRNTQNTCGPTCAGK